MVSQISSIDSLKDNMNQTKLIHSKRQPPNLQRILCKSEYVNEENMKVSKCGKNCVCCEYIMEGPSFNFKNGSKPFKVRNPFTCDSTNLLYVITCSGCREEYIGQTSRTLRERLILYRQHIRSPKYEQMYVEKHLRDCGNAKFSIFPFFKLKLDSKDNRENH